MADGSGPGWVRIADVRDRLAARGYDIDEQNAALTDLGRGDNPNGASLLPEENQKTLRQQDRVAALRFGDEDQHWIRFVGEPLRPAPDPATRRRAGLLARVDNALAAGADADELRATPGLGKDKELRPLWLAVEDGDPDRIRAELKATAARLGVGGIGESAPDVDAALTRLDQPDVGRRRRRVADEMTGLQSIPGTATGVPAATVVPDPAELRSRAHLRRIEDRIATNVGRLSDSGPVSAEQLRAAMPDMDPAEADRVLLDMRSRGLLETDGLGRVRLTAKGRERQPGAVRVAPADRFTRRRKGDSRAGDVDRTPPIERPRRAREAIDFDIGEGGKRFWTKDPEGLAKWVKSPHPATALYRHVIKWEGMTPERAWSIVNVWHHLVLGYYPGHTAGKNKTGPG